MPSADFSLGDRCFCLPLEADIARDARLTNEREEGGREDSGEPEPFSVGVIEPETNDGTGGTDGSRPGDSRPLRVVDFEPVLMENIFLALGADATRRMKRDADAPILRGDRGACLVLGDVGMRIDCWDEFAVGGLDTESKRPRLRYLSGFVLCCDWAELLRAWDEVERETQGDVEGVCEPLGARELGCLRPPADSLVSEELYE